MVINRARVGDDIPINPDEPPKDDLMTSMRKGKLGDARDGLRNNFIKSFRMKEQEDCAICMEEFVKPCKISVLKCSEKHFFHDYCIQEMIKYRKDKGGSAKCPMCRKEIDEDGIETRPYGGLEVSEVELDKINVTEKPSESVKDIF